MTSEGGAAEEETRGSLSVLSEGMEMLTRKGFIVSLGFSSPEATVNISIPALSRRRLLYYDEVQFLLF